MPTDEVIDRVTALVVTYRRPELVLRTLNAVFGQTTSVGQVLVVDNDADVDLAREIAHAHPSATYIAASENLGPGGGFGLGLRRVHELGDADWYWLLDDDSPPAPNSLELALEVARQLPNPIGCIALRGGHVRRGRIKHDLSLGTVATPTRADFVLVDGSIISAEAIKRAGYPREDFFIMMEDLEYSYRIGRAGFSLYVRPDDGSENLYQGSGTPWRGYYQCRNHLRMALELRSPKWLWGWLVREIGINAHHVRNRGWKQIRFRLKGIPDALLNRMGRRVTP